MMWLLLTSGLAWACSAEDWTPPPGAAFDQPVGWTDDGRWFAFTVTHVDDEGKSRPGGGTVDTRTDQVTLMEKAAFDAWKAEHPVKAGPTDSCGRLKVVVDETPVDGNEQLGFRPQHDVIVSLEAWGQRWTMTEGEAPPHQWSPRCTHLAWYRPGDRFSDQRSDGILPYQRLGTLTVRAAGPVVHLMTHKSNPDAVEPLFTHLAGEGYAPHIGPHALKDRDQTVVYATDEALTTAKKLAERLPGGATVELMTWASPADIVVAAGRQVPR